MSMHKIELNPFTFILPVLFLLAKYKNYIK